MSRLVGHCQIIISEMHWIHMRKWHMAERGKDRGKCLSVVCFAAFFKHVCRWPLDMLYGGFLQFGIYFSSFCSVWYVSKCFHRNKAANSKQSGGCKCELVRGTVLGTMWRIKKGLVAIACSLALLCFATQ